LQRLHVRDHRAGEDALVAEEAQFDEGTALSTVTGLLGRDVVVHERSRRGARGARGIRRRIDAPCRQKGLCRHRHLRLHRRIVQRHDGSHFRAQPVVAFAVDLHGSAQWRLQAQGLEVVSADQHRAVDVAADDEHGRRRLVVDVQFDDGLGERLDRHGFRTLRCVRTGACGQQQRRGDTAAESQGVQSVSCNSVTNEPRSVVPSNRYGPAIPGPVADCAFRRVLLLSSNVQ